MSVKSCLAALMLFVASVPAFSVEPDEILADPALEARARHITQELRCVVCQNQSVDDSDAPLARDIRILVRERLKSGDTDTQARDFIVARYGKFVLLRPPLDSSTWALWFGPFAVLVIAAALAWNYMRGLRRNTTAPQPLDAAEEAAVQRKLDERTS